MKDVDARHKPGMTSLWVASSEIRFSGHCPERRQTYPQTGSNSVIAATRGCQRVGCVRLAQRQSGFVRPGRGTWQATQACHKRNKETSRWKRQTLQSHEVESRS